MAHFGNCDPETADQEYCIFHKPNKSEEEAREFYRKFLERFKPRVEEIEVNGKRTKRLVFEKPVDVRGFVFPVVPKDVKFPFTSAIFEKKANFRSAIFIGHTTFEGAIFKNGAIFDSAIFKGNTSFEKAQFNGVSRFSDATFEMPAYFENSVFNGNAVFERTEFRRETYFENATFDKTANFEGAMFFGKANFQKCIFLGNAKFSEMCFELSSDFKRCTFEKNADFSATTFNGYVYFDETIFKGDGLFEGITFNEPVSLKGKPKEYKYKFYGKLDFSNVDIRKGISIIDYKEDGSLDEEGFLSLFKRTNALIEAARVQRLSFEREGKRDEADRMFVLEMRARRKLRMLRAKENLANAKNFKNKLKAIMSYGGTWIGVQIEKVLADWIIEYGTNWRRILTSSAVVILGTAIPYTIWGHYIEGFPTDASLPVRFADALYYSLVTFTTLGYGDMHPTGWLKALSAIEALTGAVFMALIVAVIARKWMR